MIWLRGNLYVIICLVEACFLSVIKNQHVYWRQATHSINCIKYNDVIARFNLMRVFYVAHKLHSMEKTTQFTYSIRCVDYFLCNIVLARANVLVTGKSRIYTLTASNTIERLIKSLTLLRRFDPSHHFFNFQKCGNELYHWFIIHKFTAAMLWKALSNMTGHETKHLSRKNFCTFWNIIKDKNGAQHIKTVWRIIGSVNTALISSGLLFTKR